MISTMTGSLYIQIRTIHDMRMILERTDQVVYKID